MQEQMSGKRNNRSSTCLLVLLASLVQFPHFLRGSQKVGMFCFPLNRALKAKLVKAQKPCSVSKRKPEQMLEGEQALGLVRRTSSPLGVDSPFFSAIVLFKNQIRFPSGCFLERKIRFFRVFGCFLERFWIQNGNGSYPEKHARLTQLSSHGWSKVAPNR